MLFHLPVTTIWSYIFFFDREYILVYSNILSTRLIYFEPLTRYYASENIDFGSFDAKPISHNNPSACCFAAPRPFAGAWDYILGPKRREEGKRGTRPGPKYFLKAV